MRYRRGPAHVLGLLFLLGTASCGGRGVISAKNYPQDCATAADCAAVFEGEVPCCFGGCPNVAIRKDATSKYATEFEAARKTSCDGVQPPCPQGPAMCQTPEVTCDQGICQLASAQTAAAQ